MSTPEEQFQDSPDDVLVEPESQPDAVRPTDDAEDLEAAIQEEQADRPPQGS